MPARKILGWSLFAIGLCLLGWALIKGTIIGYYPDEYMSQVLIPGIIAFPCGWLARFLLKDYDYQQPKP